MVLLFDALSSVGGLGANPVESLHGHVSEHMLAAKARDFAALALSDNPCEKRTR